MESPHTAKDQLDALRLLEDGPAYRFHDWPNSLLPEVAAGVYTIWKKEALVFAGPGRACHALPAKTARTSIFLIYTHETMDTNSSESV